MKSIVCVNVEIPTIDHELDYESDGSLLDHDIVVFDPTFPWCSRIEFSGGGSCISIEGAAQLAKSGSHWTRELSGALAAGKTVFVVLSAHVQDQAATGSTTTSRTNRTYQTSVVTNYSVIPGNPKVRNSRGRSVVVKDSAYKALYDAIKEITEYHVVFESPTPLHTVFTARDGTVVGGVQRFQAWPGSLVLLPHFDFQADGFTEISDNHEEVWTEKALRVSKALVGQLVAIDRMLKGSTELTPPPDWVGGYAKPDAITRIEETIVEIDSRIEELLLRKEAEILRRDDLLEYSYLLYESGKPLERAIEKVLRLLGYSVDTLRIGDLEIDHVILSPSGRRMIGESEGKDSNAIDISKFRQLESNIGEDFERDEIDEPAKGLLFGNGYRLSAPESRAEQFTQKSLKNANRLGSVLIRTPELYPLAVHLVDHPDDEAFRAACRAAIEDMSGGVVAFPRPDA